MTDLENGEILFFKFKVLILSDGFFQNCKFLSFLQRVISVVTCLGGGIEFIMFCHSRFVCFFI